MNSSAALVLGSRWFQAFLMCVSMFWCVQASAVGICPTDVGRLQGSTWTLIPNVYLNKKTFYDVIIFFWWEVCVSIYLL